MSVAQDGWTPLYIAAQNGHSAVVKALIKAGRADVDTVDKVGAGVLCLVCLVLARVTVERAACRVNAASAQLCLLCPFRGAFSVLLLILSVFLLRAGGEHCADGGQQVRAGGGGGASAAGRC
jgi:hypothetical protein